MGIFFKSKTVLFLALFAVVFAGCRRGGVLKPGKEWYCDAEKRTPDGKKFIDPADSTVMFNGGALQDGRSAHSGKFSAVTYPKRAFAFSIKQPAGPDWYYKVSVWRKSPSGKGVLVATTKDSKRFYKAEALPSVKDKNGWEKLEMEVFTPPFFDENRDELIIYAWNNSNDTVWFDDLKIKRELKKQYPVYRETPLAIVLDTSEYIKLYEKRKVAFENGILQSSGNDWVKGIVFGDGKMMKAKMRLKGDWLDHLYGTKWSFRIKLKKKNSWRRLRVFSVQTPAARDYLMEWSSHKFYESRDILTTRYGFVPVLFNNESRGMYAYEEHFVKQLVESRRRREGPIVKFSEDAFWQMQKAAIKLHKWVTYPFFETSVIEPFSQSKTMRSPTLRKEFIQASVLMNQYKKGLKPPAEIFDLKKLAKYYAMLDLTLARHGMAWHNQRFYYNPVLCKLEPIAYDGYTDRSHENRGIEDNFMYTALKNDAPVAQEQVMSYRLFRDSAFVSLYLDYLERFSRESFVDSVTRALKPETERYDSLLKIEFPQMEYDKEFYVKSARKIREYLPSLKKFAARTLADTAFRFRVKENDYSNMGLFENTPEFYVNAYLQKREGDSSLIRVENYFPREIVLLGTGYKKKTADFHFGTGKSVPPFRAHHTAAESVVTDTNNRFLFFMVDGSMETFVTEIRPWPVPAGITARQQVFENATLDLPVVEKVDRKNIYIKTGKRVVDYPVVIPEGYRVIFRPGTTLDFVNKAFFLSLSPVTVKGTADDPVVFLSSDFSANGFTVLQPAGTSQLSHVRFENFNTLDFDDWIITGAVTFYEAAVKLNDVTFYRNQCEDALNLVRCNFTMDSCTFKYTYSDAFDSDFSSGTVNNTYFSAIGNDAIDFSGSYITVKNSKVKGAQDKGVSGGEDSHLVIENCDIEGANIGLASKDLSSLKVSNTLVKDCNYGAVLLQKKPEYGPASMELNMVRFMRPKTKWLIEKGSYINNNGNIIKGNRKNVAKLFY